MKPQKILDRIELDEAEISSILFLTSYNLSKEKCAELARELVNFKDRIIIVNDR